MANENLALDSDFTGEQYRGETTDAALIATALPVNAVTNINGLSGPTVTLGGGASGFSFSVASPNVTLVGPLTAKGDIYVRDATAGTRLAIGANDSRLVADSAEATGLRWQAASAGWAAATGTATRTPFATSTVTLTELAERLKALIDDLMTQKVLKT